MWLSAGSIRCTASKPSRLPSRVTRSVSLSAPIWCGASICAGGERFGDGGGQAQLVDAEARVDIAQRIGEQRGNPGGIVHRTGQTDLGPHRVAVHPPHFEPDAPRAVVVGGQRGAEPVEQPRKARLHVGSAGRSARAGSGGRRNGVARVRARRVRVAGQAPGPAAASAPRRSGGRAARGAGAQGRGSGAARAGPAPRPSRCRCAARRGAGGRGPPASRPGPRCRRVRGGPAHGPRRAYRPRRRAR